MSMTQTKPNCWEVKRCGRQPGGAKTQELGICPAAVEKNLDGTHGGRNAGRACWVVAGTFCKGEVQGSFAKKFQNCQRCEFYEQVRDNEGASFKMANLLLPLLKK